MNSYRSLSCALAVVVASWCGCFLNTEGTPTSGSGGASSSSSGAAGDGGSTGGTGGTGGCDPGDTRNCYTGPIATENVGVCKGGQQACKADGMGWGPCVGETKPTLENCALAKDADCDGKVTLCNGDPEWSHAFGDVDDDVGLAAAIDRQGNTLIAGYFKGTVDFGGGAVTSANGSYDGFVAKFNIDGQILWRTPLNGPDDTDVVFGLAVDELGNVAVCGAFGASLDLGNGKTITGQAGKNAFVAKLDSEGVTQWAKAFGANDDDLCNAVAFDTSGDVIAAGAFETSINFGGKTLTTANNDTDGFVAKLDGGNGTPSWAIRFGSNSGTDSGYAVTVDSAKNVVVAGTVVDGGTIDATPLTGNHGGADGLLAKISPSGSVTWAKLYGDDSSFQVIYAVGTSGVVGDIVVAGVHDGPITFDNTITPAGSRGAFVAKLDTNGTALWEKGYGDAGYTRALSLAVDSFGNIVFAGDFDTGASFDALMVQTIDPAGDLFAAKLDPSGKALWARSFGGDGVDEPWGVAVDAKGRAALTGEFAKKITFGAKMYTAAGGGTTGIPDIFVAKLAQ